MAKLRSDSSWCDLSESQQETLEGWLFEEKLGYRESLQRARQEFGIQASLSSLAAFFHRLERERKVKSYQEMHNWHAASNADANPRPFLQLNLMNLLHVAAYEFAVAESGEMQVQKLSALMKILLQNRRQETRERELNLEIERFQTYATIAASQEARAAVKMKAEMPGPGDTAILQELVEFLRQDLFPGKPVPASQPGHQADSESGTQSARPNGEPDDQKKAA